MVWLARLIYDTNIPPSGVFSLYLHVYVHTIFITRTSGGGAKGNRNTHFSRFLGHDTPTLLSEGFPRGLLYTQGRFGDQIAHGTIIAALVSKTGIKQKSMANRAIWISSD
ncbi:hypothetical protein BD779DRAFT_1535289 [Infundibulicybe gibba]|nr:hypothetical protein BD779DRAFT_1535289 [Infundibulicybe gibba]